MDNSWANCINLGADWGLLRGAQALYRAAIKLKPDCWVAHANIIGILVTLGDEEAAWRSGEELLAAAGRRPGAAQEGYYFAYDLLTMNLRVA